MQDCATTEDNGRETPGRLEPQFFQYPNRFAVLHHFQPVSGLYPISCLLLSPGPLRFHLRPVSK